MSFEKVNIDTQKLQIIFYLALNFIDIHLHDFKRQPHLLLDRTIGIFKKNSDFLILKK